MRKIVTKKIDDDTTVTIQELTPRDVKEIVSGLSGGDIDFNKLLVDDWDDTLAKLDGIIQVEGRKLDELGFSELDLVKKWFMEVNKSFFAITKSLGLNLDVLNQEEPVTEIAQPLAIPASSSLKEDT